MWRGSWGETGVLGVKQLMLLEDLSRSRNRMHVHAKTHNQAIKSVAWQVPCKPLQRGLTPEAPRQGGWGFSWSGCIFCKVNSLVSISIDLRRWQADKLTNSIKVWHQFLIVSTTKDPCEAPIQASYRSIGRATCHTDFYPTTSQDWASLCFASSFYYPPQTAAPCRSPKPMRQDPVQTNDTIDFWDKKLCSDAGWQPPLSWTCRLGPRARARAQTTPKYLSE